MINRADIYTHKLFQRQNINISFAKDTRDLRVLFCQLIHHHI